MKQRYAVIDVETTGFGRKDSILEIGIVLLDGEEIVLEWETLINPNRDISNSSIHGINPSHLSTAPFFSDIANDVASLISNRILVAHNLPFDQRMMMNEFAKIEVEAHPGRGFCTFGATKMKLATACQNFGLRNSESHRALSDARVTALLLSRLSPDEQQLSTATVQHIPGRPFSRTITRSAFEGQMEKGVTRIRRIMHTLNVEFESNSLMSYMDALTSALSDLRLDAMEQTSLREWADALGLSESDVQRAHETYLSEFVSASERDGIITDLEKKQIESLAQALNVTFNLNEKFTNFPEVKFWPGMKICFTGTALGTDGKELSREHLEKHATERGFLPVDGVTKKGCDLLVAADINSMSSKAKKAKEWGIPIISVSEYLGNT